ncbi:uncharacterized protein LOC120204765 [Hibiscus syriacus]|uniref:uncharacterized protein LOC120204765 n=1 Tax=Hibiscus syriacus TaxID=106335 RepID=UPI00192412F9|nr:uncharacterized protein LOC120204765 [Hibiscus syriacus]
MVYGSSFSCTECEFYLHKKCAEAPPEIRHPFHRDHPLVLLPKSPYKGRTFCNFCGKTCEKFLYHCSCKLDLHVKCALLSFNIAKKRLGELKRVALKVPLVSAEDNDKELERVKCFVCREPLLGSMYFSPDCGFNLHKKCVELPPKINYPVHKNHPLVLQFRIQGSSFPCNLCRKKQPPLALSYSCSPCKFALHVTCAELPSILDLPCHRKHPLVLESQNNPSCNACKETHRGKFVYRCSSCRFNLHFECASPPLTIKENIHEHPFTLLWRQVSFICDACGVEGNSVSYTCSTCSLVVHKQCISLPPIISIPRHEHPIFHKYFLQPHEFRDCKCKICYEEVKVEYGSYSCSICKFIVHVNCALEKKGWYKVIDPKHLGDLTMPRRSTNPIICIEKNEDGEMTKIRHFSHDHDLILKANPMEEHIDGANLMEKYCDGCVLPVSNPFYHCLQCDFFLHKTCAKSPMEKRLWFHICQQFLILVVDHIFRCGLCQSECNGFAYRCEECDIHYCLHCAARSYRIKHPAHKHPLHYDRNYKGQCHACGVERRGLFVCKSCTISLHIQCLRQPLSAWHRCDEHKLKLAYEEVNTYSQYLYCDICERKRSSSGWFYRCSTCDVSAHTGCALGSYPFIKPGSIYRGLEDHPHRLTFVRKTFSCPNCHKCGKSCRDLSLECADSACDYVVHWDCAKPDYLTSRKIPLDTTEIDEIVEEERAPVKSSEEEEEEDDDDNDHHTLIMGSFLDSRK